jgi:cob(I)alamin adenosyltransferase
MVKITKVYTKKGDRGATNLAGKICISKNAPRMYIIGEIDELNTNIGYSVESMKLFESLQSLQVKCTRIQHELFNLGAQLAVLLKDRREDTPVIRQNNIIRLEKEIDEMNEGLPTLKSFILPGGCESSARLHLARTVCRRLERRLVDFSSEENSLDGEELPYVNRLSDWLFVAARYVVHQLNKEEILWNPQII